MATAYIQCRQWRLAKIPPYKVGLRPMGYGAAMAGGASQIAYGGWHKICHSIPPWLLFNNTA